MKNDWKWIWDNRQVDMNCVDNKSVREVFLELKKCNGFDIVGDGLTYEALCEQYEFTKNQLGLYREEKIKSVYEVGCGSGANLFLFEKEGIETGGCDYSHNLVKLAKEVLYTKDVTCIEASLLSILPIYDSVFSNSVFSYFENEEYALNVLEKMYQKARYSIGILDVHNEEKRQEFICYREKIIPDYKERYKNLPKLFYRKEFFERFAREHNMEVKFTESSMEGYWNNPFVYHCFLYKKM